MDILGTIAGFTKERCFLVYGKNGTGKFTIKRCSLSMGVHYEGYAHMFVLF